MSVSEISLQPSISSHRGRIANRYSDSYSTRCSIDQQRPTCSIGRRNTPMPRGHQSRQACRRIIHQSRCTTSHVEIRLLHYCSHPVIPAAVQLPQSAPTIPPQPTQPQASTSTHTTNRSQTLAVRLEHNARLHSQTTSRVFPCVSSSFATETAGSPDWWRTSI